MNRNLSAALVLSFLFIFLFTACVKQVDRDLPCKILSFETYDKISDGSYDTITARFNYDDRGNPVSIIFNKNTTGRPNYHFKYDKQGKLISMAGLWPNSTAFDFFHKFKYQGNTLVSDSMYFSGPNTNDLLNGTYSVYLGNYTFDAKKRLVEYDYDVYFLIDPSFPPVHDNQKYAYDANGNLIAGGNTYDNKKNFLGTHPVLQFMNRDFSVNNSVAALSYNKHGYPLIFDHTQPHPFNRGRFMNIGVNKIVYSCD